MAGGFLDYTGLSHFKKKWDKETDEKIAAIQTGGDSKIVALQQWIAFYNGLMGTDYDYRDYLDQVGEVEQSLYDFCNGLGLTESA